MRYIQFLFIISLFILTIFSCREGTTSEDLNIEMGYEYYPLEVGKYKVYQVDSTIYDFDGDIPIIIESTTFVKEELIEIRLDNEGDSIYILERFERKDPNDSWEIKDVWSTKRTENTAERFEENVRLIKMVFPVREGTDFDATLYVDENFIIFVQGESLEAYKNWNSEIQTVGVPEEIGSIPFNDVATITHADDENLIEKRFSQSKYAKNIGLVYREEWILDTQDLTEEIPWEEKADKGYIIRQTILDYN